jgi:hypothetical protein
MISGRGDEALDPLCVSAPRNRRFPPVGKTHRLSAARGPPLPLGRGNCQRADTRLRGA